MAKPKIAHLTGPNATIQNSPPLVTSNKARAQHQLPMLKDDHGEAIRFDSLRTQRLAAPVTVYIEQFSAHPLERDAAELVQPAGAKVLLQLSPVFGLASRLFLRWPQRCFESP